MRSRILIIILVILVLVFIGVAVYFFFFRGGPAAPGEQPPGTLPPSGQGPGAPIPTAYRTPTETGSLPPGRYNIPPPEVDGVFALSTEPIIGLALNPEGTGVRYFLESNGNVVEVGFEGENQTTVVGTALRNILKVIWSNTREDVAVFLEDSSLNFLYDFVSGRSYDLAAGVSEASFSPDDSRLAFYQNDPSSGERRFAVSKLDGTSLREIFDTSLTRWRFEWAENNSLFFSQPPSGLIPSFLLSINPETGAVSKFFENRNGLEFLVSPDGSRVLVSSTDDTGENLKLEVYDLSQRTFLTIANGVIAGKCVWSSDSNRVVCALPTNYSNSFIWPDDYYQGVVQTSDWLVRIDTASGQTERLFTVSSFDVENPVLSPDERYFMFIDRKDGIGYSVKLKR